MHIGTRKVRTDNAPRGFYGSGFMGHTGREIERERERDIYMYTYIPEICQADAQKKWKIGSKLDYIVVYGA